MEPRSGLAHPSNTKMTDLMYYSLESGQCRDVDGKQFTYINEDLVDAATGKSFDLFREDVNLKSAKAIVRRDTGRLPDKAFITCANWFLISKKALVAFQECRLCDSIRWIPTSICTKRGTTESMYYLAYGAATHDIWDYSRSDCYWQPGMPPMTAEAAGFMRKGIINRLALPESKDFFHATHEVWVGSIHVFETIRSHALTGFVLKHLDV
jgi:hypothetical protein